MMLRTRHEAIRAGRPTFFTGKACRRGHVAERYVSDYCCTECGRVRARAQVAHLRTATPREPHTRVLLLTRDWRALVVS